MWAASCTRRGAATTRWPPTSSSGRATPSIGLTAGSLPLQRAWVAAAERHRDLILPGYTHMQRAQPVLAAHYFLAFVEKFARDRDRVADCRRRLNVLPLGAAALAGTSLPIDRQHVADALGFA